MRLLLLLTFAGAASAQSILIPDNFRTCATNADCVEVEKLCNGCCGVDAIHKKNLEAFSTLWKSTCSNYEGPVCDCAPPKGAPKCVRNKCQRVLTK